jgi:hypothetical protein
VVTTQCPMHRRDRTTKVDGHLVARPSGIEIGLAESVCVIQARVTALCMHLCSPVATDLKWGPVTPQCRRDGTDRAPEVLGNWGACLVLVNLATAHLTGVHERWNP